MFSVYALVTQCTPGSGVEVVNRTEMICFWQAYSNMRKQTAGSHADWRRSEALIDLHLSVIIAQKVKQHRQRGTFLCRGKLTRKIQVCNDMSTG